MRKIGFGVIIAILILQASAYALTYTQYNAETGCYTIRPGQALTNTTLSNAITELNWNACLMLPRTKAGAASGTWAISGNLTIPNRIMLKIPYGPQMAIANGITLTVPCHRLEAGRYQIFDNSAGGTVTCSISATVFPEWWGADSSDASDDTAAIASAALALPTGGTQASGDGGTISLMGGTYRVSNWTPTRHQLHVQGAGMQTTVILGTGAAGLIDIKNISRGAIRDLTLNANDSNTYALGFCPDNEVCGATLWEIDHVLMVGGTSYDLVVGNGSANPDVATITFQQCAAQGGAFGTSTPATANILVAGTNTLQIQWFGGVIGGGQIGSTVSVAGGHLITRHTQFINSTSYAVSLTSGQFNDEYSHAEGTGGFLLTSASDPQPILSGVSGMIGGQYVNTGANTGGVVVNHLAPRALFIGWSFFNEDVVVNHASGEINVANNRFGLNNAASRNGQYTQTSGSITGWRDGITIDYGNSGSVYVVPGNTGVYGARRTMAARYEGTLSSSADVAGPTGSTISFLVHEQTNGNMARVEYKGAGTPVVTNLYGAIFVTAAPAAGEIQVKNNATNDGVDFRAGATYDGTLVQATILGL